MRALSHVYILYHRDGETPFYVGCAYGKRIAQANSPGVGKPATMAIIRAMEADGVEVPMKVVASALDHMEAEALKDRLICQLGRLHLGTGSLTNIRGGGYVPARRAGRRGLQWWRKAGWSHRKTCICPQCGGPLSQGPRMPMWASIVSSRLGSSGPVQA
jgi:hypothetical protein